LKLDQRSGRTSLLMFLYETPCVVESTKVLQRENNFGKVMFCEVLNCRTLYLEVVSY